MKKLTNKQVKIISKLLIAHVIKRIDTDFEHIVDQESEEKISKSLEAYSRKFYREVDKENVDIHNYDISSIIENITENVK